MVTIILKLMKTPKQQYLMKQSEQLFATDLPLSLVILLSTDLLIEYVAEEYNEGQASQLKN